MLEDVLREAPFATPRFHWLKDRGWLTNQLALEQKILESAERVFHAQREKVCLLYTSPSPRDRG